MLIKEKVLSLKTPAKINLFLKVLEKRRDGYHNIETLFLPLSAVFDTIKLKIGGGEGRGIKISSSSEEVPCDKTNLCYKAAEQYAAKIKSSFSCEIHIDKQIPIAAGMGGGSSDAAAVLLLLQEYYGSPIGKNELACLAEKIGADVPFFLSPIPSVGYGVGSILKPIEVKPIFYVVICAPQFPVTAAWAYRNIERPGVCPNLVIDDLIVKLERDTVIREQGNQDLEIDGTSHSSPLTDIIKFVKNDLSLALYHKFPILSILREDLISFGAVTAEITGSGPTLFGMSEDELSAKKIANEMERKYGPALKVAISPILKTPFNITHE